MRIEDVRVEWYKNAGLSWWKRWLIRGLGRQKYTHVHLVLGDFCLWVRVGKPVKVLLASTIYAQYGQADQVLFFGSKKIPWLVVDLFVNNYRCHGVLSHLWWFLWRRGERRNCAHFVSSLMCVLGYTDEVMNISRPDELLECLGDRCMCLNFEELFE
jgi:hypothetical protein